MIRTDRILIVGILIVALMVQAPSFQALTVPGHGFSGKRENGPSEQGNLSVVPDQPLETNTAVDASPPTWPNSSLKVFDLHSTYLLLVWTSSVDSMEIFAYRVYENGTFLHTVPGNITTYFVTGLTPGTTYFFQVQAGNAAGNWSTDGPSRVLTTPALNPSPSMTVPGQQTVRAGTSLTFTVSASDVNRTETVTLVASGLPAGASFPSASANPAVATFSWAVSSTQASGNYTISFTASDNDKPLASVTRTVVIQVSKASLRPILTVPGPQTIAAGTYLSFAVVASDPNLPPYPLTISASGLPLGATFNPVNGVFSWRPSAEQAPGVYVVVFSASDGQGGIDNGRVSISVVGSSQGVAPLTQGEGLVWLLPITVGIIVGLIPWALFLFKRRRDTKREPLHLPDAGLHQAEGGGPFDVPGPVVQLTQ